MKLPRDSVAIAGSVIGLSSIFVGWLTLKPNRLAAGTSLNLRDSMGWYGVAAIIVLWLLCFALSLTAKGKRYALMLGTDANLILISTFVMVGLACGRIMQEVPAIARVSPGAGVWISFASSIMLIFAARQRLDSRLRRDIVSWSGLVVLLFLLGTGWLNNLSIVQEFLGREERFLQELVRHIFLFSGSITVGILIGVPLGIWAEQSRQLCWQSWQTGC